MIRIIINILFLSSLMYALSDSAVEPPPNSNYIEILNTNRANYKAKRAAKKAIRGIHIQTSDTGIDTRRLPSKYESGLNDIPKNSTNKLFYKDIIKQRAKRDPSKYNYEVIRNKKDLNKAGIEVNKKNRTREVYNYTEVKNVTSGSFGKKNKSKNVGVIVGKNAKVKKVVNFVDVENSNINNKLNMGVKVKSEQIPSSISNSVSIKNSEIGE